MKSSFTYGYLSLTSCSKDPQLSSSNSFLNLGIIFFILKFSYDSFVNFKFLKKFSLFYLFYLPITCFELNDCNHFRLLVNQP